MAIQFKHDIKRIDEKGFYRIDYRVTGMAFDLHNEIGRLWNEKIYQNELANRCRKAGFANIVTEVPLIVSYKDFCKEYYVDLLIENSVVYELKAVDKLNPEHYKQTLNYLLLLGLQYGKLINFRPVSVEKRFVSTTLLPKDRYNLVFDDKQWLELDKESFQLKESILELLTDWGAYLETNLFYEAIYHFWGGEDQVVKDINIVLNGMTVGKQKIHLLNQDTAFKLTAITKGLNNYEKHLNKFIQVTTLNAMQWINFNHYRISFKTILNKRK